jgi:hypothetical protein
MSKKWVNVAAAIVAVVTYAGIMLVASGNHAVAMRTWSVSADVGTVPGRHDITLVPVSPSELSVAANTAVSATKAAWGVTDAQIVDVVSAEISKTGDPIHQHQKGWIVVANQDIPALGAPGVVFHKLIMVVDGRSGRYLWGYSTDPGPAS